MAVLLGLVAALSVGAADLCGSFAVRKGRVWASTLWIFAIGTVAVAVASLLFEGEPEPADLVLGALSGVAAGLALLSLYHGYARADIGIVGPTAGVVGAIVPVAVGFALDGAPGAAVVGGMGLGVVAVALIGWAPRGSSAGQRLVGLGFGALAGAFYGGMALGLGLTSDDAGVWPGVPSRAASFATVLVIASALGRPRRPSEGTMWYIAAAGAFSMVAVASFTLAAQRDLAVAGLLIQMGYGVSVAGATLFFGERSLPTQKAGFAAAIASIVLISAG